MRETGDTLHNLCSLCTAIWLLEIAPDASCAQRWWSMSPIGDSLVWMEQICSEIIQLLGSAVLNALCTVCKTPCTPHRGVGESLKLIVKTDEITLTVFIPYLKPVAGPLMHTGKSHCGLASLQPSSVLPQFTSRAVGNALVKSKLFSLSSQAGRTFLLMLLPLLLHPHVAHPCHGWP